MAEGRPFASLEGRIALVTGASRGIGRAIAEELARGGAEVVVGYHRGRDEAEELAAAIGGRAVQADVSSPDDARRLVEEAGDVEAGDRNAIARFRHAVPALAVERRIDAFQEFIGGSRRKIVRRVGPWSMKWRIGIRAASSAMPPK